ncbi:MAG: Gfo/Idh/MocA family oxidoreductase [Hyphomonas sp.]|uniref:Gfo/Idh/MocA family protein n=1 Tax=Hyphomonas sp. TaxID=87 RepID=UPI0034A02D18
MTDLKYGLIGCGMMGAEHVRNVALVDGARIAAVYDPVPELAQRAARLAGGAEVLGALDALIVHPGLDAFIICSPNFLHVSQLEAIAARRPLPVLCEKPIYTRAEDAARIAALAKDFPHPVWVAMEYRYMPPIAELIAEADAVTGGVKMLTIREHRLPFLDKVGNWNRFNENTGGTLVEKCCHFFDLMRLILRAEPVRVMASAGQVANHKDESYDGRTPDIWDSGYALFDFDNGARAMLELCMFADGTRWNEEICAVGPAGKIESRIPGPQRFWPDTLGPPPEPEISTYPRHPKNPQTRVLYLAPALLKAGDHHGSTYHQHVGFSQTVRSGKRPAVTLDDGSRAVQMALAAQQSAIEHRAVAFG